MPPRGRPVAENPRRNTVHIRLTDDDLAVVTEAATEAAKSVSDYMRESTVNRAKVAKRKRTK